MQKESSALPCLLRRDPPGNALGNLCRTLPLFSLLTVHPRDDITSVRCPFGRGVANHACPKSGGTSTIHSGSMNWDSPNCATDSRDHLPGAELERLCDGDRSKCDSLCTGCVFVKSEVPGGSFPSSCGLEVDRCIASIVTRSPTAPTRSRVMPASDPPASSAPNASDRACSVRSRRASLCLCLAASLRVTGGKRVGQVVAKGSRGGDIIIVGFNNHRGST